MINKLKNFWWIFVILTIIGIAGLKYHDKEIEASPPLGSGIPCVDVNGEQICFPYTDDLSGEDLIIRTDKQTYGGWESIDVYIMIENTGKAQNYDFSWFFTDESKKIESLSLLVENVPYQVTVDDYGTTTWDCGYVATSTGKKVKKTCVETVKTGSHKETRYRDEWQSFALQNVNKVITGKTANKKISTLIPKNGIYYLKAKIKFPRQSQDEFFIEAKGDQGGYGFLDPWYDSNWGYRRKIEVDPQYIDSELTSFPIMVRLASSTNMDFSKARSDGYDIRFTAENGQTLLDYEREHYDSTSELAIFWLAPATTSATAGASTTFYIYYGNASAGDVSSSTAPWDSNFLIVYHMNDGSKSTSTDSTSNENHGTYVGNLPTETGGKIGRAMDFDGNGDRITMPRLNNYGTAGYWEAWAKSDSINSRRLIATVKDGSPWDNVILTHEGVNQMRADYMASCDIRWYFTNTTNHIYFGFAFATNDFEAYQASTSKGSDTSGATQVLDMDYFYVGDDWGGGFDWDGIIDEVRISDTRRNDAWVKATYYSGNDGLLVYYAEESAPAAGKKLPRSLPRGIIIE